MKQDYTAPKTIEGVKLTPITFHQSLDGEFAEIQRFVGQEKLQWNHSILRPRVIKGLHIHELQVDYWYALEPLFVVLVDGRKYSPTFGVKQRLSLNRAILEIPPGVEHGVFNPHYKDANLFYVVDNFFNPKEPDEGRKRWDFYGEDLWEMPKE